jgi:transcriptional regulator with XRE-family HTH domain
MTSTPDSGHPQPKNTRPHDSEQSPSDQRFVRSEHENARARALVINQTPGKPTTRTVRNEKARAGALVIPPDETLIRTQPGEVTGPERDHLANGFGKMLRNMRTTQGFSQTQLKRLAGVTQPYISYLERGLRRPTPDVIEALARALVPEDQQPYLIQRLTEEAGDSIRESWARQKLRSKSRWVRREVEHFRRHQAPKLQTQINRLYDSGRTEMAEQLEQTLEALTRQIEVHERAAKDDLATLGNDPDEPVVPYPRRAPKHFRKRSYGPR